jgi:CPA2 family monovalent cation:H+ antiporter-2
LNTALTVGASLAQIGEFSFILAGMGLSLGLLPVEGQSLILAGALISIAFNSLIFKSIAPVQAFLRERSPVARKLELRDDPLAQLPMSVDQKHLTGQVVIVGYGRVGRRIGDELAAKNISYVVAESNRQIVEKLRQEGINAVSGDAADPAVLIQAHIARAGMLVIATNNTVDVRKMVETARLLNPQIDVVLRAYSEAESALLEKDMLGKVFVGKRELALGMTKHILVRMGVPQT